MVSKPVKEAVSYVIYRPGSEEEFLIVLRPEDDPDLPGVWGLPAGSKREGESWEEAVLHAGMEKLGVELRILLELAEGEAEREGYTLRMRLYEAAIAAGRPRVPGPFGGTQYEAWRWGVRGDLEEAASEGSLCCSLYLARGER